MKKAWLISTLVIIILAGCAGNGKHVRWAPSLSSGLNQAASADKHTILEFTSPT